jgi:tetratricopeptide (TPR) repeat protein
MRRFRASLAFAPRVAPGIAVAVGGALLSTFTAIGWWIAVVAVPLIVIGLAGGLLEADRRRRVAARPRLPDDPGRLPPEPAQFMGPDHLRVARELQECLTRPGAYLVAGLIGSGKTTICAKVLSSAAVRRLCFHAPHDGQGEDRRFWADLEGRRRGAEVEDAIAHAVGADSLHGALAVLADRAATLLVLDGVDETFGPDPGEHPVLRRLMNIGGGLRLVVTARGELASPTTWSGIFTATTLPEYAARALFAELAPERANHPVVGELLDRCDGLPLAVAIVGRLAATARRAEHLTALAARAFRGAGDSPGGRRLQFALTLCARSLDREEQEAWWALSQFPAGLSRDDLQPVLGMFLAEYHVAHLYQLGLAVRAGAGLRVPAPLRLQAHPDGEDQSPSLRQQFVGRGLNEVSDEARAGPWLSRHAINLAALAERRGLPEGSLRLACEALKRVARHSRLTERALVSLTAAALHEHGGAESVVTTADVLVRRSRLAVAAQLYGVLAAFYKCSDDRPAAARALVAAGDATRLVGDYEEAERLLVEAQAIFDESGDRSGSARAHLSRADLASARGRYEEAERLLAEAQAIFDERGDRSGGAAARLRRGTVARLRNRDEEAERLLAEAQAIYEAIGDRQGGADTLRTRGVGALKRSRDEEAERLLAEAQAIYEAIGDRLGTAHARLDRSEIAYYHGRDEEAERLLAEAQAIFDESGDRRCGARARERRGEMARVHGHNKEAEQLLAEAQAVFDEIGDRKGGADTRTLRGEIARVQGRDEQAEPLFRAAQSVYDEIGEHVGRANTRKGRGLLALTSDRYEEAERLLAEAQSMYDYLADRLGGAHARWGRGELTRRIVASGAASSDHLAAGLRWFLEAQALFEEMGDLGWQGDALLGAARCCVGERRTALATRAASCLEASGRLIEARALEEEFGIIVSVGTVLYNRPRETPSAGQGRVD